jgi:N-acetylglucosaminyldiphosphoundecaprenol N-acetyl-beta-D-mannosaminyltransferase
MRVHFLGCPLDLIDGDEIVERVKGCLLGASRIRIEGLNVAKLIDARRDKDLHLALEDAEIVHADGMGIHLGSRVAGLRPSGRRAGIDLMWDLVQVAGSQGASVYLLGGKPGIAEEAAARFASSVPDLTICGYRDGYFSRAEELEVVEAIRASGAQLLLIGISSPKKELFLRRNWERLGVQVAMGVGGSFDVVAGHLKRAPVWMQRAGLEWLFRMAQEPQRLAWRYIRTNTAYLILLTRHALGMLTAIGERSAS